MRTLNVVCLVALMGLTGASLVDRQMEYEQDQMYPEDTAELQRQLALMQQLQIDQPMGEPLEQEPVEEEQQVPQENEEELSEQENAFILPLSKPLGNIAGLGMDSKERLIAFHRADRHWDGKTFTADFRLNKTLGLIPNSTIAVIDPASGQVTEEHGENLFYLPHGLTVDHEDNLWVTDVGSHQIHKLDKNFKPVLTLGEKLVPGSDGKHFCKPTDVAVAKNGFFFVADGYCNARVMKFDPKGNLVDIIESEEDPFLIPHSLTLVEDLNMLCVADRENERVQCFSAGLKEGHRSIPAGIPITSADDIGRVYAIRERKHYLVGVTGKNSGGSLEPQAFVMDMNSGKARTFVKGIENAHAIAVSPEGVVYIAQMDPNQIVALSLLDE